MRRDRLREVIELLLASLNEASVSGASVAARAQIIWAFRELGVDDVGIGDPIEWERRHT